MIHLLGSLLHFFFHLTLIGFHWIIGFVALVALLSVFTGSREMLGGFFICAVIFAMTPSGFAAQTPTHQTFSNSANLVQAAYQAPTSNCDPSYPDFCIAPAPPDLDCKDIKRKNFTVRQPDPHQFDRDKDGIGCES
jgi:hypothetical protein